jgi:hypothetical protein
MPATVAPAPADREIAVKTFRSHLEQLWSTGRPKRLGWECIEVDPMHIVVKLPARRPDGQVDQYFFRLGAIYYDAAPPTVELVRLDGEQWVHAENPSPWFPIIEPRPPWFGLHTHYQFPGGKTRQLVCFSFAAEFYQTNHSPQESEMWRQGRHTLAATLYRLAEVLEPPYYQRPSKVSP